MFILGRYTHPAINISSFFRVRLTSHLIHESDSTCTRKSKMCDVGIEWKYNKLQAFYRQVSSNLVKSFENHLSCSFELIFTFATMYFFSFGSRFILHIYTAAARCIKPWETCDTPEHTDVCQIITSLQYTDCSHSQTVGTNEWCHRNEVKQLNRIHTQNVTGHFL